MLIIIFYNNFQKFIMNNIKIYYKFSLKTIIKIINKFNIYF